MKNNCWICGKEYDACISCDKLNGWKRYTCSPEHYQIHVIISEYKQGIITAKEATEQFATYGITADSELHFLDKINKRIKAIIAEGTPKRIPKSKNKSEEITDKSEEDTDE